MRALAGVSGGRNVVPRASAGEEILADGVRFGSRFFFSSLASRLSAFGSRLSLFGLGGRLFGLHPDDQNGQLLFALCSPATELIAANTMRTSMGDKTRLASEEMANKINFGIRMCMYNAPKGKSRNGLAGFWGLKGGLTRYDRGLKQGRARRGCSIRFYSLPVRFLGASWATPAG